MTGLGDAYICAACGKPSVKGWSDEEAMAEAEARLNIEPGESLEIVCDPCSEKIIAWARIHAPEALRAEPAS